MLLTSKGATALLAYYVAIMATVKKICEVTDMIILNNLTYNESCGETILNMKW